MKSLIKTCLTTGILLLCVSGFSSNIGSVSEQASDLGLKIKRLDLLNQILPVLMTKEQMRKILPAIEKSRAEAAKLSKAEADKMKEFEARVDTAIKEAEEKNILPPDKLMVELAGLHTVLFNARNIVIAMQVDAVTKVVKETLNEGQIKSAANALSPKFFDPGLKLDEVSDDQKLKLWVRWILMDSVTYDILLALSK